MIKEGDYVYLHELYPEDVVDAVSIGVYKVYEIDEDGDIYVLTNHSTKYFLAEDQYYKIIPNKINKLLYNI